MTKLPLVTFGIVNCNRLHYMKSCLETLIECTSDYPNREFIVVDNASVEAGTGEYLNELESRGVIVVRNDKRDPANEFARGINTICKLAKGAFVAPLQGDMQFIIRGGWLMKYVEFMSSRQDVGCVCFDAQRGVTHATHKNDISSPIHEGFRFVADRLRPKISGAADVMYKREIIEMIFPWSEKNVNHEGSLDSETEMIRRSSELIQRLNLDLYCFIPVIPVAVAIYTDSRGTNARVRGNRLYGDYWAPKQDDRRYYDVFNYSDVITAFEGRNFPVSIEEIAKPVMWTPPIGPDGNWLKNPIRPESAGPGDYVELIESKNETLNPYVDEWLNSPEV